MQARELWATIIERNVISVIISVAQCCIFLLQASWLLAYQAYSLFMSTHSLCANNANVIQAIRCLAALCLKAWVFVGQMDAAPWLPSPLTPHRCPILAHSSVTKRWKISNAPEPTCQCARIIRRVGAALRRPLLRKTRGDTAPDERGKGAMRCLSVMACLTNASGLNRTQAAIHKLRG